MDNNFVVQFQDDVCIQYGLPKEMISVSKSFNISEKQNNEKSSSNNKEISLSFSSNKNIQVYKWLKTMLKKCTNNNYELKFENIDLIGEMITYKKCSVTYPYKSKKKRIRKKWFDKHAIEYNCLIKDFKLR